MKIDNSRNGAIMSGKWSKPGSGFYNALIKENNALELIEEAYLIHGKIATKWHPTSLSRSGCKYPHHAIKNGKLVVSAPGVKAAYARAKQMGIYKGDIKRHLDCHLKELGLMDKNGVHYEEAMEEGFRFIESTIDGVLGTHLVEDEDKLNGIEIPFTEAVNLADPTGEKQEEWLKNHPAEQHDLSEYFDESIEDIENWMSTVVNEGWEAVEAFDGNIENQWFIQSDDGADNCCIKVKGYDKPMRGRSSMITLKLDSDEDKWYVLCKKNTDDYGVPGGGWNKGETPEHAAIRELHEETLSKVKNVKRMGTLIEYHDEAKDWVKEHVPNNDEWWYGYYSAIFVGIYDGEYKGKVNAEDRESGYTWKKVDYELMKEFPKEYQDAINDYINKEHPFKESVFNEKSHGVLKYCYRIGYDINTGTKVAIEFELSPEHITTIGDPDLTKNAYKKANGEVITDERLKNIHSTALEYIKQRIRKIGHIDFITNALPIHSIFDESHKRYEHVKIIGLFNNSIKRVLSNYFLPRKEDGTIDSALAESRRKKYIDCVSMTTEGQILQIDMLMKKPEIREMILSNKIQVESYSVNETGGANKYKTTKLIWDRKQFDSLKLTPVIRGVIPSAQDINDPSSQRNAANYINNSLINKYRDKNQSTHTESSFFEMHESHDSLYESKLIDDIINLDGWISESSSGLYCRYLSESAISKYLRSLPYDMMLEKSESPYEIVPEYHLTHSSSINPLFLESLEGSTLDAAIIISDWCTTHNIPNYIIEATISTIHGYYLEGCVIYESDGKFVISGRIVSNGVKSADFKTILENISGSFGKYFHTKEVNLNIIPMVDSIPESVFTEAENDPPPVDDTEQQKPTSDEEQSAEEDLSNKEGKEGEEDGVVDGTNTGGTQTVSDNAGDDIGDNSDNIPTVEPDPGSDSGETGGQEEPQTTEEEPPVIKTPISRPKQFASQEKDKNGVRRKNLYIEFIRWAKDYNNKNIFGSNFDKDIFNGSYPFVPEEMRYFYRLADPTLCILSGGLTFFPVIQLRKLNSENKHLDQYMIFAATDNDLRVFNREDGRVYLATVQNNEITLTKALANTFDTYIQIMIDKGDILNGPREDTTLEYVEDIDGI